MIRYLIHIVLELIWWEYQLVGTFETQVTFLEGKFGETTHDVYIHCFESRWGTRYTRVKIRRKSEFWTANIVSLKRKVRRANLYQTVIYPWLHGRWSDKIPSFKKVKGGKWDFLKKLKGETSVVLNDDEK